MKLFQLKSNVLAASVVLLLAQNVQAEQFYKWVMPDGSTRYSQDPPPARMKGKTAKVFINTGTNAPAPEQKGEPAQATDAAATATTALDGNITPPTTNADAPISDDSPVVLGQ